MAYESAWLPKVWVEAVPRWWDESKIPADYPRDTNVKFSEEFASAEEAEAVKQFKATLGTEESVVTEHVPEHTMVDEYLGTFDVVGTPGELTLLSPNKVGDVEGVVALHYTEGAWQKVEDAHVVDGYVYGTLESFSPIAVFTVKRSVICDLEGTIIGKPAFIANGVPVIISMNDAGEAVIKDDNGGTTIIAADILANLYIIGGTVDGTDLESTSVVCNGLKGTKYIIAGSYAPMGKAAVKNISLNAYGCEVYMLAGAGFGCRADKVNMTIKKCVTTSALGNAYNKAVGTVESWTPAKDYSSIHWVKESIINIEDSEIEIMYGGACNGESMTGSCTINAKNCKAKWFVTGSSNGYTEKAIGVLENCEIGTFAQFNRGHAEDVKAVLRDCKVEVLATAADPADKTGTVGKIKLDICGGTYNLYAGTINSEKMTAEQAAEIVDYVKYDKAAEITFVEDVKEILGDKLIIK